MKYDIPTLLALRHNAHIDIERFTPHAFGNNLLRRRRGNLSALSEWTSNRSSRNFSNFSSNSETGSSYVGGSLRLPFRQPSNPPHGAPAQTDNGFAKFLKEHASPKHQRVTAGGRIVPMSPETPVPKMKIPMKRQDASYYRASAPTNATQSENSSRLGDDTATSSEEGLRVGNGFNATSTATSTATELDDRAAQLAGYAGLGPQLQNPSTIPTIPFAHLQRNVALPFDGRQFFQPEHHPQNYMAYWPNHGAHSIAPESYAWMHGFSQPSSSQNSSASLLSASSNQAPLTASGVQSDGSASSLFGMTNQPVFNPIFPSSDSFHPFIGHVDGRFVPSHAPAAVQQPRLGISQESTRLKFLQDAKKEHERLSTRLSRLDRYTALHTWELNSRSKKALVEQRIDLVRKLDAVRSYKEQLESDLAASRSNVSNAEKKTSTESMATFPQPLDGNTANGRTMQMPWMPNITTNNAPPVIYSPALANAYPPLLPINNPIDRASQWKEKENPNQSFGGAPANLYSHNTTALPKSEWTGAGIRPPNYRTEALATESTESRRTVDSGDAWATPTTLGPPNVQRVYRRIEDAISRGEPVEELLRELATVTARNARTNSNSNGSPQPVPRRVVQSALDGSSFESHNPEHVFGEHLRCNTDTAYIANMFRRAEGSSQPMARAAGRPWKSEESVSTPKGRLGHRTCEAEDEDDAGTCSSFASASSWATIQDGDNDGLESQLEIGKLENQARPRQVSEMGTRATISDASSSRRLSSARGRLNRTRDDMTNYQPVKAAALSSSSSNMMGQTMPDKEKPQFLAQCLNNKRGFTSQKTPAVAVSQNVNAHAFLPSFDGAGDERDGDQSKRNDEANSRVEASAQMQQVNAWHAKEKREKPSPAVLRGFFQRIQEEERIMIYQSQSRSSDTSLLLD